MRRRPSPARPARPRPCAHVPVGRWMSARALLWDLDGTLVDSEPLHARSTDAALASLGLSTPPGFHDASLGLSAEQTHSLLVQNSGLALPLNAWDALKMQHFRALSPALAPRQPAARLAEAAGRQGHRQAVVSNSGRNEVDLALTVTGLAAVFAVSISRDDVRHGKPHPEGYRRAAHALDVDPALCLAIEDSTTGAEAALSAGVAVILHPQMPHSAPPASVTYLPPEGDLSPLIEAFLSG